jgi:hypothetical protein
MDKLAEAFSRFANENPDLGIDFESDPDGANEDTLESLVKDTKHFYALGFHGSGSLMCVSRRKDDHGAVVWIDSEGSAFVLARDIRAFLSVIPYDTGYVYDVGSFCAKGALDKGADRFPAADAKKDLADALEGNEGRQALVKWLESQGIKPAADPFAVVADAVRANPKLNDWLGTIWE